MVSMMERLRKSSLLGHEHQLGFHVGFDFGDGDELDAALQELFEYGLRQIRQVGKALTVLPSGSSMNFTHSVTQHRLIGLKRTALGGALHNGVVAVVRS